MKMMGGFLMNRFGWMRFLFNAGRRSQQVIGLFNRNRNNNMRVLFSTISMILSAVSIGRKVNDNFKTPVQAVADKTQRSRRNMSLQPVLAEYAEEFLNNDDFNTKQKTNQNKNASTQSQYQSQNNQK